MANRAKRIRIDSSVNDDAADDYCTKFKEEPSKNEALKEYLAVESLSQSQKGKQPLFQVSESCSFKKMIQDPSDPSTIAVLTGLNDEQENIGLKIEISSDEQDSNSSNATDRFAKDSDDVDTDDEDAANDYLSSNHFWNSGASSIISVPFTRLNPVLESPLPSQPYEIFRLIFNDELLDLITCEINQHGRARPAKKKQWVDVTRGELLKLLGLIIHTGSIRMHHINDYWRTHYLFNMTCFSRFMSRCRFKQILKRLSFSSAPGKPDPLTKIQPIIDHFNKVMKNIYCPDRNLVLSEFVFYCKTQLKISDFTIFKTMDRNHHWGPNMHVIRDETGVAFKLKLNSGRIIFNQIVLDLLEGSLDCGHAVFLSEIYNSVEIAETLMKRKTQSTGPVARIKGIQGLFNSDRSNKKDDDIEGYYRKDVHLCKNNDRTYISTEYNKKGIQDKINVVNEKEESQEDFKAYHPWSSSMPWHRALIFHVLHLAVINAYHIHAKLLPSMTKFEDFRLEILEKLLPDDTKQNYGSHVLTKIEKSRPRKRLLGGNMVVRKEIARKECKGCKLIKKRSATMYECLQCEGAPGFCVSCFSRMHTDGTFML